MQAPFAFDSDGNLVISAKMVEALGLGKRQDSDDTPDAIRFGQINTEAKARAEADSALARRAGDLEAAITTEQQARADADSALAADLASLNSRLDSESTSWQTELEALREEVVTRHNASEADISSLEVRISDLESTLRAEIARIDGRIDSRG